MNDIPLGGNGIRSNTRLVKEELSPRSVPPPERRPPAGKGSRSGPAAGRAAARRGSSGGAAPARARRARPPAGPARSGYPRRSGSARAGRGPTHALNLFVFSPEVKSSSVSDSSSALGALLSGAASLFVHLAQGLVDRLGPHCRPGRAKERVAQDKSLVIGINGRKQSDTAMFDTEDTCSGRPVACGTGEPACGDAQRIDLALRPCPATG